MMIESGTHDPPVQLASSLEGVPGGRSADGTQWAGPWREPVLQQAERLEMFMAVGAVGVLDAGVQVVPSVPLELEPLAEPAPPSPSCPAC
jgi:hypothetical protein